MKKKEKTSYIIKDGKWVKASKWMLFKQKLKIKLKRYKVINTYNNRIIPRDDMKRYFSLSPLEYEEAQKIYKEKGTISYEFYPCAGISWGVRVKVLKTGEIIDITDVSCW